MKRMILKVGAILLVVGAAPVAVGMAQGGIGEWREGAFTDYFLEPDCERRECVPSQGEECCTYWFQY